VNLEEPVHDAAPRFIVIVILLRANATRRSGTRQLRDR
jgi:hypothetical protein